MQLNHYQLAKVKSHKGLTLNAHLGNYFQKKPQEARTDIVKLLASNYAKTLDTELEQYPTKHFETEDEYYWKIMGSDRRNVELVAARVNAVVVTSSDANVGRGGSEFELIFKDDIFHEQETIVGELNELFRIRITDLKYEGASSNAVCTCVLWGESWDTGMPASELISGKRFSTEYYVPSEELHQGGGGIDFVSYNEVREHFTPVRLEQKASGKRTGEKLVTAFPYHTKDGKIASTMVWMEVEDYQFQKKWSIYKANTLMFGRDNTTSDGSVRDIDKRNNVKIKSGAGIREQMQRSNMLTFDKSDNIAKLMTDALYSLSFNKLDFGNRVFIVKTGQQGSIKFHQDVLKYDSGWLPLSSTGQVINSAANPATVMKTTSPLHQNAFKVGYQITEFMAPNGVTVRIEVSNFYDDMVRFKKKMPGTVFPLESYRYDIMYIGTDDMREQNIVKCIGGPVQEFNGYEWGPFRNPFTGQTNNQNASTGIDIATRHAYAPAIGAAVYDPSRVFTFIPIEYYY